MTRLFHAIARIFFSAISLFAALYCVIAWVPFTWHQVIEGRLLPGLDPLVRCYPLIYAVAVLILAVTLRPHLAARGWPRILATGLITTVTLFSAAMFRWPVLANLGNNSTSLLYGLMALLPLALLAATDIVFFSRTIEWNATSESQLGSFFCSAIFSSLFVTALWAAISWSLQSSAIEWGGFAKLIGVAALSNVTLFLLAFLALDWICAAAGNFRNPAAIEFWFCHLCFGSGLWLYLQMVVARTMGLAGWGTWAIPAALAGTVAALHAAMALSFAAGTKVTTGLGAAFGRSRAAGANFKVNGLLIAMLAGGSFAAVRTLAGADWNYLLQTTVAVFFWVAAFVLFYRVAPAPSVNRWTRALLLIVVLASYRMASGQLPDGEIERWAGYDASFRLARTILAARPDDASSFYKFLALNTNIAASTPVRPANIEFAPLAGESGQRRPHIFIFVIDSLRRDYLSPYNNRVWFTPDIGEFAKENIVFEKAFTHYGGTGLSEPSIWTGSMMVHKQYVTPFEPMNALQKLVRAEKYREYLSRDSILHTILQAESDDVELDPSATTMSYEFGKTIATLEKEIAARPANAPPIFAYTQPQNVHVSVIRREGGGSVDNGDYNGFYAPYASRVRHIDAVFGEFVRFLKAKGLYDDSVIILAADHGDSLGEDGRWGHAYTLFPEIVRIPLLMHVPSWLGQGAKWNRSEVVFSTDITPTLYRLLGHDAAPKAAILGRPLFTQNPDMDRSRDPGYLLASSYAPVYGALSGDGSQLFVSDAVNDKDYLFDLRGGEARAESLAPANATKQKEFIRRGIGSINQLFQFHNAGESL